MKLLYAVIHGFGKFYQKTFSFQDGIHVIHGPNEAGKSTLHTFLGCMLFGLERGRGRAARGDLYSRCLPWDHDATYGGTLSFESDDQTYQIERNFRSDRRSCLFGRPGTMPTPCSDSDLTERYYEGLTESLYYNTISVRSLGCAPDANLAEELRRQLTGFHQTGSDTIDHAAAVSWLKAERKRQEAQLDPTLEKQLLQKKQALAQLEHRLESTTFQEQKIALEQDMDHCLEQLAERKAIIQTEAGHRSDADFHDVPQGTACHDPSRLSILPWLLVLGLTILAGWLWFEGQQLWTAVTGTGALVMLLFTLLRSRRQSADIFHEADDRTEADDEEGDRDYDNRMDNADEEDCHDFHEIDDSREDPRVRRLLLRFQSLQKQYESVCRQEWDHDRLLEQAQSLEEDLEQLTIRAAEDEAIRLEIQAISLALSTLQTLAGQMQDTIGPLLGPSMSRILDGLTGGAYTQVYVDGQLNVSVRHSAAFGALSHTGTSAVPYHTEASPVSSHTEAFPVSSRTVPLESLSRGTIEQVYLAMRLAVIDLLFPQGGMPLILDDCFLTYDDERLTQTLLWLAENYSGQVFIFTCQKREAALLRKEQIPFTDISL